MPKYVPPPPVEVTCTHCGLITLVTASCREWPHCCGLEMQRRWDEVAALDQARWTLFNVQPGYVQMGAIR